MKKCLAVSLMLSGLILPVKKKQNCKYSVFVTQNYVYILGKSPLDHKTRCWVYYIDYYVEFLKTLFYFLFFKLRFGNAKPFAQSQVAGKWWS